MDSFEQLKAVSEAQNTTLSQVATEAINAYAAFALTDGKEGKK